MPTKRKPKLEITPEILQRVETYAGLGLSQDDIGLILDITGRSIRNYKQIMPELDSAYKKGQAVHKSRVTSKLWEQINANNLTAIIFYLKTKCGWRETATVEVEDKRAETKEKNKFKNLSTDELQTLKALMKKAE